MSVLQYNELTLDVVRTLNYHREPVYDQVGNYCWTKHVGSFQCWYNPSATTYRLVAGAPPANNPPQPAPTTDVAIRHKLMQPRRQFVWEVRAGEDFLVIPEAGKTTDAQNGPTPLACDVQALHGTKTFQVRFDIELAVNESGLFTATPPLLLSHSWRQEVVYDDNFFETRTTTGQAIFRRDLLDDFTPDDFRQFLFPQPIKGFKRVQVHISAGEDPNSIQYTVIDRMVYKSLREQSITNIECSQSAGVRASDLVGAAMQSGGAVGSGINAFSLFRSGMPIAGTVSALSGVVGLTRGFLPLRFTSFVVKVHGSPSATRLQLFDAAVRMFFSRAASQVDRVFNGFNFEVSLDLMRPYLEMQVTGAAGLADQFAQFAGNPFAGIPDVTTILPMDNNNETVTATIAYPGDRFEPVVMADTLRTNNRGINNYSVVAQLLTGQDVAPSSQPRAPVASAPTDPHG